MRDFINLAVKVFWLCSTRIYRLYLLNFASICSLSLIRSIRSDLLNFDVFQ
jgi:hypothetical protein